MPQRGRRLIGAWCFLDHAGPAVFSVDSRGLRVGPHPHTGLQTFTWMLTGDILHRDSVGSEQVIALAHSLINPRMSATGLGFNGSTQRHVNTARPAFRNLAFYAVAH